MKGAHAEGEGATELGAEIGSSGKQTHGGQRKLERRGLGMGNGGRHVSTWGLLVFLQDAERLLSSVKSGHASICGGVHLDARRVRIIPAQERIIKWRKECCELAIGPSARLEGDFVWVTFGDECHCRGAAPVGVEELVTFADAEPLSFKISPYGALACTALGEFLDQVSR